MSFGLQVINELARRRELGMYFDYAGYRALRNVESVTDAGAFLRQRGYPNAPEFNEAGVICDWLRSTAEEDGHQNIFVWLAFDPLGGMFALPIWLIHRLSSRRG
jgi:hypothetical protein